jgi:hypothetical protein
MPGLKDSDMFVGQKRKRIASGTENAHLVGAKTGRGGRRFKRAKGSADSEEVTTESDSMEVDNDSEADEPCASCSIFTQPNAY